MAKIREHKDVIHATKEGRMYIKSEDFFKQEKVIKLIEKLENSTIVKEIRKTTINSNSFQFPFNIMPDPRCF